MALPAMFTAGLIAQGVSSGFKTTLGLGQWAAGALMRVQRPEYEIPDEVKRRLALRRMNLNAPMAGYNQARADIARSQATTNAAARNIRDSSQVAALAAAGQAGATEGRTRLAVQNAVDYQRRLGGLENAQMTMAQYKDKAFQLNEYEPYMNKARTKAALIQGGLTNINRGLGSAASGLGQMYGQKMYYDYLNSGQGQSAPFAPRQAPNFTAPPITPMFQSQGGIGLTQMPQQPTFGNMGVNAMYRNYMMNQ